MSNNIWEILLRQKCKRIVIYGDSRKNEGAIRKASCKFDILQMDFENQRGTLDEIMLYQPDAVILTKQLIARQDIFIQLMEYCHSSHAFLYDLRGRDLGKICEKAELAVGKRTDKRYLLELAEKYDAVSFDIFDTLLMRKVLRPEDVFELIERELQKQGRAIRNFKKKRIAAQEALGLSNPNIYDIYGKFQKKYKISDEQVQECIRLEIQIENEVLVPRTDMVDIFKKCVASGKKVSLITDMYLPACVLEDILDKNGIVGYQELFVSCDAKQLKLQGLFELYKEKVQDEKYLHIGDHKIHDGICAGLAGIDYILISSGVGLFRKTGFAECTDYAQTLEERVMLGLVIAKLFNSPFVETTDEGRVALQEEYDYGYGICAPLISKFAVWLYETIKKEAVDNILFAARDGYLMQTLYCMTREAYNDMSVPEGIYFYTSRKAAVMTGINNEAFINMIIDISNGMPPKKMMRERFGLESRDILSYQEEVYGNSIDKYVWAHAEAIFKRADLAKRNYFKYMGNIGLEIGKTYAFMDFVSSGTTQKALARMAPFEIKGFYAGWNGTEDERNVDVKAMFKEKTASFLQRFKIMETFITSLEPSVNYFDDNGNPVFSYQDRSERELKYVSCMQDACVDFLQEFLKLVLPIEGAISNEFVDRVFAVGKRVDVVDKNAVINHLVLMDDWRKKRNHIEQIIQ